MPTPTRSIALTTLEAVGELVDRRVGSGLEAFCVAMDAHLRHFTEVGVQVDPGGLAAVTLGHGDEFTADVVGFMRGLGFDPDQLATVPQLQRAIEDWMLVRAMDAGDGDLELGLYFRRSMSLEWALAWLADRGVSPAERAALQHLDRLVGSGRTGIVAARLKRGEPTLYKVYLSVGTADDPAVAAGLARAFRHFQVPEARWGPFLEALAAVANRVSGLYLSVLLGDGDAFDSLKLDMFQVPLPTLDSLLESSALSAPGLPRPTDFGARLELDAVEHCGLRFQRDAGVSLTLYFVPDDEREG